MGAILTVIGKDKVGIIAAVSNKLADLEVNIVDVSQTLMDEYFTMMMRLNIPENADFAMIKETMAALGQELGLKISVQNEEIFNAMHKL